MLPIYFHYCSHYSYRPLLPLEPLHLLLGQSELAAVFLLSAFQTLSPITQLASVWQSPQWPSPHHQHGPFLHVLRSTDPPSPLHATCVHILFQASLLRPHPSNQLLQSWFQSFCSRFPSLASLSTSPTPFSHTKQPISQVYWRAVALSNTFIQKLKSLSHFPAIHPPFSSITNWSAHTCNAWLQCSESIFTPCPYTATVCNSSSQGSI